MPEATIELKFPQIEEFLPVTVRSPNDFTFQINIERCASNAPKTPQQVSELENSEKSQEDENYKIPSKNLLLKLNYNYSKESEDDPERSSSRIKYKSSKTLKSINSKFVPPEKKSNRRNTLLLSIPVNRKYSNKHQKSLDDSPVSSVSSIISEGSSFSSKNPSLHSNSSFHVPEGTQNSAVTDSTPGKSIQILFPAPRPSAVIKTSQITKKRLPNGEAQVNQYHLTSLIGCGAFGKVYKAINEQGENVAIKVYNKRLMRSRWIGKRKTALSIVSSEIKIMENLFHENILNLIEVMDSQTNHKIYLVLEYASGGTLNEKAPLSEDQARFYYKQLIDGIEYLHDVARVLHRDIKPQNILLNTQGTIKICDFGSAQSIELDKDDFTNTVGTYPFMAPELHGAGKLFKGAATDIWASGITLYYLITGKIPYNSRKSIDLSEEVKTKEISLPSSFSRNLTQLLYRIFDRNPETRASINEIRESKWFRDDN